MYPFIYSLDKKGEKKKKRKENLNRQGLRLCVYIRERFGYKKKFESFKLTKQTPFFHHVQPMCWRCWFGWMQQEMEEEQHYGIIGSIQVHVHSN